MFQLFMIVRVICVHDNTLFLTSTLTTIYHAFTRGIPIVFTMFDYNATLSCEIDIRLLAAFRATKSHVVQSETHEIVIRLLAAFRAANSHVVQSETHEIVIRLLTTFRAINSLVVQRYISG